MKTDFEHWLSAQIGETGPFTLFIVLVSIAGDEVVPLKTSYAHLIGDDMAWREMGGLLDRAGVAWDGVAFFVGLGHAGGPLPDVAAARKLREVEADVKAEGTGTNALRRMLGLPTQGGKIDGAGSPVFVHAMTIDDAVKAGAKAYGGRGCSKPK